MRKNISLSGIQIILSMCLLALPKSSRLIFEKSAGSIKTHADLLKLWNQ